MSDTENIGANAAQIAHPTTVTPDPNYVVAPHIWDSLTPEQQAKATDLAASWGFDGIDVPR